MKSQRALLVSLSRSSLWASLVLLVACGGGSGGGSGESSDASVDTGQASFVLSGTIFIPEAYVVDNDVNDPQGQNGPRNNPDDSQQAPGTAFAQTLSNNPVAVVGYVNRPREGPDGATWASGDVDDYYRVTLRAGQVITLSYLSVDSRADLDLYLYDEAGEQVIDSSLGTTGSEQLQITSDGTHVVGEDGTYVVGVFANAGAANYVLTIGLAATSQTYTAANLRHNFIPGEALVTMYQQPGAAANGDIARDSVSSDYVGSDSVGSDYVASYATSDVVEQALTDADDMVTVSEHWLLPDSGTSEVASQGTFDARAHYVASDGYQDKVGMIPASLLDKWHTLMHLKTLGRRLDVAQAVPNMRVRASALPNDPRYAQQWHYPLLNLPQAWDISTGKREGGGEVIVAVVDSGILMNHPDLREQLVAGYDFVSNVANAGDGDGRDPWPEDVKASGHHGTHVAGTIAARSNNGLGVAGVAWEAKIMPLRAIGLNGGSFADVLEAVKFAAGLPNASGQVPPRRADIINLSLGTANAGCLILPVDPVSEQVFRRVREAGVIVVAAAGNDSCGRPSYPAGFDSVVSVSAVALDRSRAGYSNYGATIDIAAPGGDVMDLDGNGTSDFVISTLGFRADERVEYRYGGLLGTSMATPHVSGVVALMTAVAGQLTPAQLDGLIRGGRITSDLGRPGRDDLFGYGLIDAYQAVLAAGGAASSVLEPALRIAPETLNFGRVQTMLSLNFSNSGDGEVTIESVVADQDWLTVVPAVSADGLGAYRIVVDRAGQAEGNYFGALSVSSSLGVSRVPVAMSVLRSTVGVSDAGRHYVLLIDADTNEVVNSMAVDSDGGRYRYRFSGVEGGKDYVIIAGTDLDNDQFICGGADACGAYPSWSEPQRVTVGASSISGLDFSTRYLTPLSQTSTVGEASLSERSVLLPDVLARGEAR